MPKARAYRDFRIGDVFDIHPTSAYKLTNDGLFKVKGKNPIVANGSINNGIVGFSGLDTTEKGNMITFSDTTTSDAIFYQPKAFIGYPHVQGLYPKKYQIEWNEVTLLYLMTAFKKCACGRFDYATKFTRVIAANMQVKMPVNERGDIDFQFIENYMQAIKDYRIKELNDYLNAAGFEDCALTKEEEQALKCNKYFNSNVIGDLFEVKKGKRLTKANMIAGDINFIGATSCNNGVTTHISNVSHLHSENLITVTYNGSVGESFYQPSRFWASDDVNVMYSKFRMTEYLGLYFATLFRKQGKRYGYSYKWTKEIMEKDSVSLPVDIDGRVDYSYMETYVRAIMKQIIGKLKAAMTTDSENVAVEEEVLNIIDTSEVPTSDRFSRFLPLYDIAVACGALVDEGVQSLGKNNVDMEGWIDVSEHIRKPNDQMFVVRAKGESMLPKIHPGDLCVFEAYGGSGNAGSREGQIVLARQSRKDNDYNCQYTIKLYHSEKDPLTNLNTKIELRPLNKDGYDPIIFSPENEGEIVVLGVLKEVIK